MALVDKIAEAFSAVGVDVKSLLARVGTAESKLAGIEPGATADQTGAEIATAYEAISTVNRYTTIDKNKLAGIEAGATADQTAAEITTAYESTAGVNRYTSTDKNKVGFLTVTAATDLDAIRDSVAGLGSAVVLKGSWSAATAFPTGTKAGWSYIVSVAGSRDGVDFEIGDRLISLVNNASTTLYASNWFKSDGSDKVSAVNGRTGAVTGLQEAADVGNTATNLLSTYTTSRDA